MREIELKPCPFCGGKAAVVYVKKLFPSKFLGFRVMCNKCGKSTTAAYATKGKAAKVWNKRVGETNE